ncbi:MAG: hypothetical protein R2939_17060 [Kofleriaceae bacterium]
MIATAPGKLIVAGEYAVLRGGVAVVTAVDRRVVATTGATPRPPAPLLDALAEQLDDDGLPAAAARARTLVVDSSALVGDGGKLGLGSSAAVVVAAAALAVGDVADRARLAALASSAHARFQGRRGAPGSGADVAAATWGGTLAFRAGAPAALTLPTGLAWLPFFTGAAADTATLVVRVEAGAAAAPVAHAAAIAALADAADRLVAATTVADAIAALDHAPPRWPRSPTPPACRWSRHACPRCRPRRARSAAPPRPPAPAAATSRWRPCPRASIRRRSSPRSRLAAEPSRSRSARSGSTSSTTRGRRNARARAGVPGSCRSRPWCVRPCPGPRPSRVTSGPP